MLEASLQYAKLLGEILRIQRWAGGDSISAAKIFGLIHGFENVLDEEKEHSGISTETVDKVEELLQDVEEGTLPIQGMAIKGRLEQDGIDELDAEKVMQYCVLNGQFADTIKKVAKETGFSIDGVPDRAPEMNWYGALHYVELVDGTEGARTKMHAVFSPCVPRIGETVTPEKGSPMVVIGVDYLVARLGADEGLSQPILIPHVVLEPLDENDNPDEQ